MLSSTSPSGSPASLARRAAALLRGGVPSRRVFGLLAQEEGEELGAAGGAAAVPDGAVREAGDIARRIEAGESPSEAIAAGDGPGWRVLAAAWALAETSGAPLAPALDRIAAALRGLEELQERREVLLAGPRATVRLVTALPPLALVLGGLLGFDPVPVLLGPLGIALLAVGGLLLAAGWAWARALQRRVSEADRVAGLELDLAAIALGGGAAPEEAMRRVVDAADRVGAEWVVFDRFRRGETLAGAVETARASGIPLAPLLAEEAEACRARDRAELEREAERLGIRVLIPLGVCVLPSFVVLGVLPVLIAMLGGL
ncbi:type II secretion system F family protein [Leucobacter allii]|uniref:type II secretion system F family protein n=1 Tax=Leucobacter allii TaxID=2932247 RepID=UPI001FD12D18|nr:type II secretion system F family protein [Leucobacter allii]UOR00965.1 type II secretion system F family protein [Leucobacter allii]